MFFLKVVECTSGSAFFGNKIRIFNDNMYIYIYIYIYIYKYVYIYKYIQNKANLIYIQL